MEKISLFLLLLFSPFVFAQKINQTDAKGKKQGVWEKKYPNSNAYEYKGQFKDDKPVGTFYYYYPSTKKKAIIVHDEKTGRSVAQMFHEEGTDLAYGIYLNQKKDSVWTYYGPSGRLSYRETYKNGKLNGPKTVYYVPEEANNKTQRVAMVQNYADDLLHGEEIEYFEDGTIKSKGTYEKGKKVGQWIAYNASGGKMTVNQYKNGVLHGWQFGYNEAGKQVGKRYYKDGLELTGKELDKWIKYCQANKIDPNK